MLIRLATPQDADALVDLVRQLGYATTNAEVRSRIAFTAENSRTDALFVADVNERVRGLASVHLVPQFHRGGTLARLTALVVDDGERRRGIGKALVRAVEEYATKAGSERVELTSGDERTAAHEFYEALGYQRVSQRFIRPLLPEE